MEGAVANFVKTKKKKKKKRNALINYEAEHFSLSDSLAVFIFIRISTVSTILYERRKKKCSIQKDATLRMDIF